MMNIMRHILAAFLRVWRRYIRLLTYLLTYLLPYLFTYLLMNRSDLCINLLQRFPQFDAVFITEIFRNFSAQGGKFSF